MSLGFFKTFRNTAEVKLFNFQTSVQSRDFEIKTQSLTVPEKVGGDHNMYEGFQIIISLTDILELLVNFGKIWELVLKWKCLISKMPHRKLILALLMEGQCFMYQKKTSGEAISQGS